MTTQKLSAPGYEALADVLERAYKQASEGKGKERHANDLPFDKQPMQTIAGHHGVGFLLGQAEKKTGESYVLPHDRAIAELLGAINYIAGAVVFLEAAEKAKQPYPNERRQMPRNGNSGAALPIISVSL